jgi:putative transposase
LLLLILTLVRVLRAQMADDDSIADFPDLETARQQEAERRLRMLGPLADQDYRYEHFRDRANTTSVPLRLLRQWHKQYRKHGRDGLLPADWEKLKTASQQTAMQRYEQLQDVLDSEIVDEKAIAEKAHQLSWPKERVWRWVNRYRAGGLWGLAPEHHKRHPLRRQRNQTAPIRRALGSLTDKETEVVEQRIAVLGWLLDKDSVSDQDVNQRATETGKSARTLWSYLTSWRTNGLAGLAPKERSDKGKRHGSEWMEQIIEGIYLSHADIPFTKVHSEACRYARERGEPEPTLWKVRAVCEAIPEPVVQWAHGRRGDHRNKSRVTGWMRYNGLTYEIDHTLIDVLVKDKRNEKARTKSGVVRPWITLCIEANSRVIVAAIFSYDRPDRFTVSAAIHQALLRDQRSPVGGIPQRIDVDMGEELVSKHVRLCVANLDVELHVTYIPEHKPHVERFFRTLNEELWRADFSDSGYVGSNVTERNENAEKWAKHTIADIEAAFWKFITTKYHQREHSELGMTPLEYWERHCFPFEADPRDLDLLLPLEEKPRKVFKGRISCNNRTYWHADLATLVGRYVQIRTAPHYESPKTIEVFHNGQHICTAFDIASDIADRVPPEAFGKARREQRAAENAYIHHARAAIEEHERQQAEEAAENQAEHPDEGASPEPAAPSSATDAPAPSEEANTSQSTDTPPNNADAQDNQTTDTAQKKPPKPKTLNLLDIMKRNRTKQEEDTDGTA